MQTKFLFANSDEPYVFWFVQWTTRKQLTLFRCPEMQAPLSVLEGLQRARLVQAKESGDYTKDLLQDPWTSLIPFDLVNADKKQVSLVRDWLMKLGSKFGYSGECIVVVEGKKIFWPDVQKTFDMS